MNHWPALNLESVKNLNETTNQVHYAAQFLAAAGKAFVENQADDSHTNMAWHQETETFMGHPFAQNPDLHLALKVEGLQLEIHNAQHKVLDQFSLIGRSLAEGESWLKEALKKQNIESESFTLKLHYDIPDHPLAHGARFEALTHEDYQTFSKVRTISDIVLPQHLKQFENASSLRTWPHHFDHGTFIPLKVDEQGNLLQSIGLGLAIHEAIIPEYYFYITHWSKEGGIDYSNLPDLPSGGEWYQGAWTGAILKVSQFANADEAAINLFIKEAIQASLDLLK